MSAEKKNKTVKGRLEELRRGLISRRESREGLPGRFPLNKGLKERWERFPQAPWGKAFRAEGREVLTKHGGGQGGWNRERRGQNP